MLLGKNCIVTGASRGMGKEIARVFLENGARVTICSRSQENLAAAADDLGHPESHLRMFVANLAQPDQCASLAEASSTWFGPTNVLVNCAGIITREPTLEHSQKRWNEVFATNLNAAFFLAKAIIPEMINSGGGTIINIASQMAHMPHPGASPSYECSKAALVALTRHLAMEFGKRNVRVNAISPGSIDTGLQKDMDADTWARIRNAIPLGRLGSVREAANAALYLASDMSSYSTGSVMYVTGGSLMD